MNTRPHPKFLQPGAARFVVFGCMVLCSAAAARLRASDAADVEARLKQDYLGRNALLRGLYHGDQLDYDAQGHFMEGGVPGTWTLDGVVTLTDFKLRGDRLEIAADRTIIGFSYRHQHLYALPDKPVEIIVHLGPLIPRRDALDQVMSQIFMIDAARLLQFAPMYWKPVIQDAVWAQYAKHPRKPPVGLTLFAPLIAPDRGQVYFTDGDPHNGLDPPQPIDEPPPYYPEIARYGKKQGTVLIAVLIDQTGAVRDALLLGEPLGAGLDQSSVNAVRRWKYRPATRNGAAVSVIKPEHITFSISGH
jgi:TonB family protein